MSCPSWLQLPNRFPAAPAHVRSWDPELTEAGSKSRTAASPDSMLANPSRLTSTTARPPLLRRRGHRRDGNVRKPCIIQRLAYLAVLLRVVHELGHRSKRGRLAFCHRDRNADLLKCSTGYARARHLLHIGP